MGLYIGPLNPLHSPAATEVKLDGNRVFSPDWMNIDRENQPFHLSPSKRKKISSYTKRKSAISFFSNFSFCVSNEVGKMAPKNLLWALIASAIVSVVLADTYIQLNLGKVGEALNVVTMDQSRSSQVVEFTYDKEKLWYDQQSAATSQSFPDQVTVLPQPSTQVSARLSMSSLDYYDSKTYGIGLGVGWTSAGAAFSAEGEVMEVTSTMNTNNYAHISAVQEISIYSAQLSEVNLTVTKTFYDAVQRLPNGTSSGPAYDDFVADWGTHVITSSVMGGSWRVDGYLDRSYAKSQTAIKCELNMKMYLNFLRGSESFGVQYSRQLTPSSTFKSSMKNAVTQTITGGHASSFSSSSQYVSWVENLRDYPGATWNTFTLISDFVTWDDEKQQSLKTYLDAYARSHALQLESYTNFNEITLATTTIAGASRHSDYYSCPANTFFTGVNKRDNKGYNYLPPKCQGFGWKFGSDISSPQSSFVPSAQSLQEATQSNSRQIREKKYITSRTSGAVSSCGVLPCFPGSEFLGTGFDIVLAKSRPAPIMELTYGLNQSYTSPMGSFIYPDQAQRPDEIYSDRTTTKVFRSLDEISSHESGGFHLRAPIPGTPATLSFATQNSWSTFFGQTAWKSLRERTITKYDVSLTSEYISSPNFTNFFIMSVNKLPSVYNSETKADFGRFIEVFGTHVVSSASVGGKSGLWIDVDMSYEQTSSSRSSDIGIQSGFLFGDMSTGTRTVSSSFSATASGEMRFAGGQPETLGFSSSQNSNQKWVETVDQFPIPVSWDLIQISDFVPVCNGCYPGRQMALAQAIEDYIKYYQVLADAVPNIAIHLTSPTSIAINQDCGSSVLDPSPHYYHNGNGDYWIKENDSCYKMEWHDTETGKNMNDTPYVSNPYTCDSAFTSSFSCENGMVKGTRTYTHASCGTFGGKCYYWTDNLLCTNICVTNKLLRKEFTYWWN